MTSISGNLIWSKRLGVILISAYANFNFKPVLLKPYYLYQKNNIFTLSMIGPDEWSSPYGNYIATVRQLGDGTWEGINEI